MKAILRYDGPQECPGEEPKHLWTILLAGHPLHEATFSEESLRRQGIPIPEKREACEVEII